MGANIITCGGILATWPFATTKFFLVPSVRSPALSRLLLKIATVARTLDESFSNNGQLEIWAPDFLDKTQYDLGHEGQAGPKASVTTTSRYV